ncbi:MAG: SufD family Fe-S cluster assembly protein [bacterium]
MSNLNNQANKAKEKKAGLGPDINIDDFIDETSELPYENVLEDIDKESARQMKNAGIDLNTKERSGTFIQKDHSIIHCNISQPGVELMDINQALDKYDWLSDYLWKIVPVDKDKYTSHTQLKGSHGYFIRTMPGVKAIFPLQACLYLAHDNLVQSVHNIIIAEENSEMHIITGCAVGHDLTNALHIGVSEFYIKKGARVTFTMIHNWAENVAVRPRSGTIVEEGGVFISNYICMKPVKTLQMYPTTLLEGNNSVARYNSILVSTPESNIDVGAEVTLRGKGSRAEIVSRAISTGGKLIARGRLIGEISEAKAHLECRGLILSREGNIIAIPELEGKVRGVELSHEAAVGKIAQEEIEYLMARGLNEDEATAVIVRGFLNVDIKGLPEELKVEIDKVIHESEKDIL